MSLFLEMICQAAFVMEAFLDSIFGFFFNSRGTPQSLSAQWLEFLGASAWLIVSMGRIKWENDDWRAYSTGVLLVTVAGVVVARLMFG
ncbi:MAG: hypothetical protein JWO94_1963, partial [Verrucomicrobiaceae bacterium]|nr:hypothetical protein [Verrucomicrobiaceae bacterium]